MTPRVTPLIAGNWKMNGLRSSLRELRAIARGHHNQYARMMGMVVCPPATLLAEAVSLAAEFSVEIGGQDCHPEISGAHTGDISAEMIADAGARWIIVGHSERRTDHSEDDATVKAKAEASLRAGLMPIVCIGETEAQRRDGETLAVLGKQLDGSLPETPDIVIAYEPVWAIGTGLTPTTQDIADAHTFIRDRMIGRFGRAGETIRLLYGGSVKPGNAAELLAVGNVDGALVGGASLTAADFLGICAGCPVSA